MQRETLIKTGALFALVIILAIGAFTKSIWFDEAWTLHTLAASQTPFEAPSGFTPLEALEPQVTGLGNWDAIIKQLVAHDVHPPLYFLLLSIWGSIFGESLLALRLMGVVLSAASIIVFYQLLKARRIEHAVIYTSVFALSHAIATTAHEARSGALIILLVTLALRLSLDRPDEDGPRTTLWRELTLAGVTAALMYTHYFTIFYALPLMAYRGWLLLWRREAIYLVAPIVTVVLFVPWIGVLLHHMEARPTQGVGFTGLYHWSRLAVFRTLDLVFERTWYKYPEPLVLLGTLMVMTSFAATTFTGVQQFRTAGKLPAPILFALWMLPSGLLVFTLTMVITDRTLPEFRYFLGLAPFAALVSAYGLLTLGELAARRRAVRRLRLAPLIKIAPVVLLISLQLSALNFGYEVNEKRPREYWKSLAGEYAASPVGQALVVIDTGSGKGDTLVSVAGLPYDTRVFFLNTDVNLWAAQINEVLRPELAGLDTVILYRARARPFYTDTSQDHYAELSSALEQAGFTAKPTRLSGEPSRFYTRWGRGETS